MIFSEIVSFISSSDTLILPVAVSAAADSVRPGAEAESPSPGFTVSTGVSFVPVTVTVTTCVAFAPLESSAVSVYFSVTVSPFLR